MALSGEAKIQFVLTEGAEKGWCLQQGQQFRLSERPTQAECEELCSVWTEERFVLKSVGLYFQQLSKLDYFSGTPLMSSTYS